MRVSAIREWVVVYLKGLCMGAADTVPGVSGGTIALIAGIYERLITAITELDPEVVAHIPRLHSAAGRSALRDDLLDMDIPFLVVLGLGIVTAVVLVAGVMHDAAKFYPVPTYSFFFGLIAVSAVVLYRYVSLDTPSHVAAGVVGFALAFLIAGATPGGNGQPPLLLVFAIGAIAICAMILPGISGAFVLYLFGQYQYMTDVPSKFIAALFDVATGGDPGDALALGTVVVTFVGGALVGLLTVSHVIRYALTNYRQATLTFLVSLMVGSLRAPVDDVADNVEALTPQSVGVIVVAALVGGGLVFALDRFTDDIEFGGERERPQTNSPMDD